MNERFTVETSESDSLITQELVHEASNLRETIHRRVVHLMDQGIVDALKRLGWTPPASANELALLRADAERFRWAVKHARWIRHEHEAYVAVPVALDADLSCQAMRVAAIDKARADGVH